MTTFPLRRCPAVLAMAAAVLLTAPTAMAATPPAPSPDASSSTATQDRGHGRPSPPADTGRQVERFKHQLDRAGYVS
ncbi:hypothetical protein [Kitasatospora sp. NPDC054795]